MHIVALTHALVRAAAEAGMSDDAVRELVDPIAANQLSTRTKVVAADYKTATEHAVKKDKS